MYNTYYYYTITIFLIRPWYVNPTPLEYFLFLFISSFLFSCFLFSSFFFRFYFFFHCPFLSTSTIYCTNSTEDYGISIQFNLRHNKVSLWHKIQKLKSSSNKGKEQHFYCRTRSSFWNKLSRIDAFRCFHSSGKLSVSATSRLPPHKIKLQSSSY